MSVDVNKPVTNPDLLEALRAFNQDPTLEKQSNLFDKFKKANLLAPVMLEIPVNVERNDDNSVTLKEGTTLQFITISSSQDQLFYPAFTDWDELRKWKNEPNQQTLVVSLSDYTPLLSHTSELGGIVLNPFGDNIKIDRSMLQAILLENIKPQTIEKKTKVLIGDPEEYPQQLVDAVTQYLQKKSEIKRAFLKLMIQNEEQSFLIVLDLAKNIDEKIIFNEVANIAKSYLPENKFVDLISADTSFGRGVIEGQKPFYQKENKGLFSRFFSK